ncbi:MAG TPA: hypothetical protein VMO47_00780 [Rhodothermales bacterium]|nr:hypothetical protein [Rhodothermales bacterium]
MHPASFILPLVLSILQVFDSIGAPVGTMEYQTSGRDVGSLEVQLLFDGQPLLSKKRADFSCFDYTHQKWINCRIEPADGVQRYVMARPAPGRYRMHVGIDEDEGNPDSYAGDYEAIHYFDFATDTRGALLIDVPKLIHLTSPVDNGRSVEGAFGACRREPDYTVPFISWHRTAPVAFSWDPVADGAEYHVSVRRATCDPYGRLEAIATLETGFTSASFELPRNEEGEHYQFAIEAVRNGRPVGVFHIHDAGTHGWDYRFRVTLEDPNPRIAGVASLGAVFFFFLVALAFMLHTGNRPMAATSLVVLVVSGWLAYTAFASYREDHRASRNQVLEARLAADELQQSLNVLFLEEWAASVPKPDWWDEVALPDYPIDNVGELLSVWQSGFGRRETRVYRERQFFKGAYQAIVDHPGDRDLASTAIDLMAFIGRDYPHRREMLELAVRHFFDFDQRTDNCANCMIADRTNSFVVALAQVYVRDEEYEAAISLIERFGDERRTNVSNYAWAETITVLGEAYWKSGNREQAVEVIGREAAISGDHPYIERLHEQLADYRSQLAI